MTTNRYWLSTCVLLLAGVTGCSDGDSKTRRLPIEGSVRFDAVPVQLGSVVFVPIKGTSGPAVTASVIDGKYKFDRTNGPVIGTYKVRFLTNAKPEKLSDRKKEDRKAGKGATRLPTKIPLENFVEVDVLQDRKPLDLVFAESVADQK